MKLTADALGGAYSSRPGVLLGRNELLFLLCAFGMVLYKLAIKYKRTLIKNIILLYMFILFIILS